MLPAAASPAKAISTHFMAEQLRGQLLRLKWDLPAQLLAPGPCPRRFTMKMISALLLAAAAVRVMRSVYNLPIQFRTTSRPSHAALSCAGKRERVALVAHPGEKEIKRGYSPSSA